MNGMPRRASSARIGRWNAASNSSTPASGRSGSGLEAPIPPVFGPTSPSSSRLWSRASGSATASRPSHSAMRLASRPCRRSSTTTQATASRRSLQTGRRGQLLDGAFGLGRRIAHDHALACRQAIRLDHDAVPAAGQLGREGDRRGRVIEGGRARHPDAGRARDVVTERLARLDPGRRLRRPEDGEACSAKRVGDAGRQRRLRPDDDQLGGLAPGDRDDRRRIERVDARRPADAWLGRDGGTPGRDDHLVDARFAGQLPGERMLAGAAPDDEDPGRHDQAHADNPGRLRIGRHARSIVCVRSGPTDTRTIGTPACASMADT